MVVFGVQSVLLISFKPKAFRKLNFSNSPAVVPFDSRTWRYFRCIWFYMEITVDIGFQVQFNAEFTRQVTNSPWITWLNENKEKNENSYNLVCFYPGARSRKPFQSQLFELSLRQRIGSMVSRTRLNLRRLYFSLCLFLHLFSNFLNKLNTISRIIDVFTEFTSRLSLTAFFEFPNYLLERENSLHLLPLWWQNWTKYSVQAKARKV